MGIFKTLSNSNWIHCTANEMCTYNYLRIRSTMGKFVYVHGLCLISCSKAYSKIIILTLKYYVVLINKLDVWSCRGQCPTCFCLGHSNDVWSFVCSWRKDVTQLWGQGMLPPPPPNFTHTHINTHTHTTHTHTHTHTRIPNCSTVPHNEYSSIIHHFPSSK